MTARCIDMRHCERSEAIHLSSYFEKQDGLPRWLRLLAMTGVAHAFS